LSSSVIAFYVFLMCISLCVSLWITLLTQYIYGFVLVCMLYSPSKLQKKSEDDMGNTQNYVAVQQLQDVHKIMGSELYLAFDILATNLANSQETAMPVNSARSRAELREARRILLQLKHPNPESPVHKDEMAWALQTVIAHGEALGLNPVSSTMRRVALMLAIDVAAAHEIPHDLDKKIGNAVKVLLHGLPVVRPLAVAS